MTNVEQLRRANGLLKLAEDAPRHNKLTDILLTTAGLKGMEASSPLARGKWRQWHGSTPENMRKMKREGIRTMGEARDRGHSLTGQILDGRDSVHRHGVWEKSKNMAFTGRKATAKDFIAQAMAGPREASLEWLKSFLKNQAKARFIRPLSVEIPIHETAGRVKVNPEYVSMRRAMRQGAGGPLQDNPLMKLVMRGMSHTRGIKGGVRPEEIAWGKGWKPISMAGIKAKPLRALAGILGLGASATVAGYGMKDLGRHAGLDFGPKQ